MSSTLDSLLNKLSDLRADQASIEEDISISIDEYIEQSNNLILNKICVIKKLLDNDFPPLSPGVSIFDTIFNSKLHKLINEQIRNKLLEQCNLDK